MPTYNALREKLNLEHIGLLRNLDAIYTMKATNFVTSLVGMNADQIAEHILTNLPTFVAPFQNQAAQLALSFYTGRRQMAEQNFNGKVPSLKSSFFDLDLNNLTQNANRKTGVLTALTRNALDKGDVMMAAPEFAKISASMVTDVDRDTILTLTDDDTFAVNDKTVRVARPGGCNVCKMIASQLNEGESIGSGIHNNCHCVFDAGFRGERAFVQNFGPEFKDDFDKAKKLIENGEAGKRTVQVDTPEWNTAVQNKMASGARKFRKENEVGLSPEEKVRYREDTQARVQELSAKAGKVAQGLETYTKSEIDDLENYGFPPKELNTELFEVKKNINSFTSKNLSTAMDIIQGNREVKQ